jgi:hypothetical protein
MRARLASSPPDALLRKMQGRQHAGWSAAHSPRRLPHPVLAAERRRRLRLITRAVAAHLRGLRSRFSKDCSTRTARLLGTPAQGFRRRGRLARWVLAVAPQFPACRFVLGWVEPNMDLAGSLLTGCGPTRQYDMAARRKERIYVKHQRRWSTRVRRGEIPDHDDTDLLADWDADAEVSDLLIARWESTVLRRLRPQAGSPPRTGSPVVTRASRLFSASADVFGTRSAGHPSCACVRQVCPD